MPGGDRTGPMGRGPMTGRGAGFCAGYGVPGYMGFAGRGGRGGLGFGRGMGRGSMGRGRGWRNRFWATGLPGWARFDAYPWGPWGGVPYDMGAPVPEQEVDMLKQQAEMFEKSLGDIRRRIDELSEETKIEKP